MDICLRNQFLPSPWRCEHAILYGDPPDVFCIEASFFLEQVQKLIEAKLKKAYQEGEKARQIGRHPSAPATDALTNEQMEARALANAEDLISKEEYALCLLFHSDVKMRSRI